MKHTLTVTWPRGAKCIEPACERQDGSCAIPCAQCEYRVSHIHFANEGPCYHAAFRGAVPSDDGANYVWSLTPDSRNGISNSVKNLQAYGADKVRHLRSWGITGTYTVS